MNFKLVFVPEWYDGFNAAGKTKCVLSESILTAHDVNNYLVSQYNFYRELLMLDKGLAPFGTPLEPLTSAFERLGATDIASTFKLLMKHGDLVDPNEMVNPKEVSARLDIQKALVADQVNESEESVYTMKDSAQSYIMQSLCIKRYVRFSCNDKEDTIFINMSNELLPGCVELDLSDHANLRSSLLFELLCYSRTMVSVNGNKGNGRVTLSKYPAITSLYSYYISYGL